MSTETTILRSVVTGTGSYLPKKILTNRDLESMVETSDEWITQRSGIRERHIADDSETTSFMATEAARRALEMAKLQGRDIDGVIVGTATPDRSFPSVATSVQRHLGIKNGPAFDLQAACSGFIYALSVADALLKQGRDGARLLVIGAEKISSLVNWADRATCVLFGDGAGAVVLEARHGTGDRRDRGILSTHLHADGTHQDILYTDGGVCTTGTSGFIHMEGKDVFRYAVNYMSEIVNEILLRNEITADQVNWLLPHQANLRIIEGTAKKLGMRKEQVIVTVDRHGNTSAASIPLAFDEAVRDGRVKPGDLLMLEGLGAGLTWGGALLRY